MRRPSIGLVVRRARARARHANVRPLRDALATVLFVLMLSPGIALANWAGQGVPVCIPPAQPSSNHVIATAADGAGGCFVVWLDGRNAGVSQVYAQRLDPVGAPLWTVNGVRVAPTNSSQATARVLPESNGGALIVWADNRAGDYDIYVQRLTANGGVESGWPAAGWALTIAATDETVDAVLSDGSDGAFVAWFHYVGPTDWDVRAGRITGAGTIASGWPAGGIPLGTPGVHQSDTRLAGDGAGGVIAVWGEGALHAQAVRGCRISAAGVIATGWTAHGVPFAFSAGDQSNPRIVESSAGRAIVAWEDDRNGDADVYAQRVAADGSLLWGAGGIQVCGASDRQTYPELCPDGFGGAIAVWGDSRDGDFPLAVYAQRLAPNGAAQWTAGGLKVSPDGVHATSPMLVGDGQGGAIVAWIDQRMGLGIWDVYAQHVVDSGQRAWPEIGLPVCTMDGNQWDVVLAPDTGGGAILTWRDNRATDPGIYAWQATGLSNLSCTVTAYGWSSPVAPRDAIVPGTWGVEVTPTLEGNIQSTYLNWLFCQEGPNPVPAWMTRCEVDDSFYWEIPYPDNSYPTWWAAINIGPYVVRGGRHTLTSTVDVAGTVPEWNESDNVWSGQWVWSPLPLTRNVPVQRELPPDPGVTLFPNSDGMQFTRTNLSLAWVVSLAERATSDDYDLVVYDDYSGSSSGFSYFVGWSGLANNNTDYVVGHYSGTPATVYPAVVRYDAGGGGHSFFVDATDADGRNATVTPADWPQVELPTGRLADVYEMYLNAGVGYGWTLLRLAGQSDLEVRVFPPTPGGVHGPGSALGVSVPVAPGIGQLGFTAVESGWHPVVVSRTTGDYAIYASEYTLRWNTGAPADVPGGTPATWELAFLGATPNPARESAVLRYSVPGPTAVRLEVFDLNGRRVRMLVDGTKDAGPHSATWDCRDADGVRVGSGIYWARLTAQGRTLAKRMSIMR